MVFPRSAHLFDNASPPSPTGIVCLKLPKIFSIINYKGFGCMRFSDHIKKNSFHLVVTNVGQNFYDFADSVSANNKCMQFVDTKVYKCQHNLKVDK